MKICCMTLQLAPFQPLWFWWLYVEILEPPDRTNLDPWLIWRELLWRATGLAADFLQVRIYCVCVRESIIVLEFIYPCSKTYPTLANTCGKITNSKSNKNGCGNKMDEKSIIIWITLMMKKRRERDQCLKRRSTFLMFYLIF